MEDKINELENRSRRQNIVVKGIDDKEGETWEESKNKVEEILDRKMKIKVDIVRAHRVGRFNARYGRPIVVKLEKERDKEMVMRKKNELKGSLVFIEEDYSLKTRALRKKLFDIDKKERERGKRVIVTFDKVIIDGKQYAWNQEREDLEVGGWPRKN